MDLEITLQTPRGAVVVRWDVHGGSLTVDADIPLGTIGTLRLPGGMRLALKPSHMSVTMPFDPSAVEFDSMTVAARPPY